jgi:branched-chain amino acid transport system substrate-binding protein
MKVLNRFRALASIAVGLGALSAVAGAWAPI